MIRERCFSTHFVENYVRDVEWHGVRPIKVVAYKVKSPGNQHESIQCAVFVYTCRGSVYAVHRGMASSLLYPLMNST